LKKILILFAHPALQKSRINIELIKGLDDIENITFHDLYEIYPEFDIDVTREQQLLTQHDVIILHHPFFWYSAPAMIKEWQDLVLEHGWAYGSTGSALKDKIILNVITAGGRQTAYSEEGYNHFTVRQLLAPFEQTATMCQMIFLPPFVIHGTHSISKTSIPTCRADYHHLLELLVNEKIDMSKARSLDYLNTILQG
jgi:glutathione-regulated potassium-efflux system ancillary protein KefG